MDSLCKGRKTTLLTLLLTGAAMAGLVSSARADGVSPGGAPVVLKMAPAMVQEFDARSGFVRTEVYGEESLVTAPVSTRPESVRPSVKARGLLMVSAF